MRRLSSRSRLREGGISEPALPRRPRTQCAGVTTLAGQWAAGRSGRRVKVVPVSEDVLLLLDELDALLRGARVVPFTEQVRVDRETVAELLDLIREALP